MSFLIFIPRTSQVGYRWSTLVNALYLTFSKILFTFGVALVILPTLLGLQSWVRTILDNKFTNFISKISFMMYLSHLLIIMSYTSSRKVETYYSAINLFTLFVAHACEAVLLSLLLVFLVEVPAYKLQKKIMAALAKSKK